MKTVHHTALSIVLAAMLAIPATALLAADEPAAKPAEPTSPAVTQERMKSMHERMRQIQKASDPAKRKELVAAQMKDMEAMMNDPNRPCPMGKDGMMEGKCGMAGMGGKGGMAGMGGMGMMAHHDDALEKRMESLEKRLDMMQMMMMMHMHMQMQMRMGMPGMMQPGMMQPGMMQPGMMPGMMMMPAMPTN